LRNYLLVILVTLTVCHTHKDHDHDHEEHSFLDDELLDEDAPPIYFYTFTGTETINGVPPETRIKWMEYAMQTRIDWEGTPCPTDTFGAVIINRTSDQLLCQTNQTRSSSDPTDHAESRILRICANFLGTFVKPNWSHFSLYTTGESCAMCAAAQVIAGMGEMIYATTINHLHFKSNIPQILLKSLKVVEKGYAGNEVNPGMIVIAYQYRLSYFNTFFDSRVVTNPCPPGCYRNGTGGKCVKTTPELETTPLM